MYVYYIHDVRLGLELSIYLFYRSGVIGTCEFECGVDAIDGWTGERVSGVGHTLHESYCSGW